MSDAADRTPGELVLYTTSDGRSRVQCRFVGDTLTLSQAELATWFDKNVRTVNEHLLNIFEEGEVDPQQTIRKFRIVRREGAFQREVAQVIEHSRLDAFLAPERRAPLEAEAARLDTERAVDSLTRVVDSITNAPLRKTAEKTPAQKRRRG